MTTIPGETNVQDLLNVYEEARWTWARATGEAIDCRAAIVEYDLAIKGFEANVALDPSIDGKNKEVRDAQVFRLLEADPGYMKLMENRNREERARQHHEAAAEDAVHAMRGVRLSVEWETALVAREAAMSGSRDLAGRRE